MSEQLPAKNTQARLPKEIEDRTLTIATMKFGETYYTTPWAMWADRERLLWLHPDYELHDRPHGTVKMRVSLRADGYHVWVPPGESYKPRDSSGFVGGTSQPFIPVAVLHPC